MSLPLFDIPLIKTAVLSECLRYRYRLVRDWTRGDDPDIICWVMLNPSTADARDDDPTIRRCISFSKSWGYTRLVVVNLYAYRATDPKEIGQVDDPVGKDNHHWLDHSFQFADEIVAAWGTRGHRREDAIRQLAARYNRRLKCLGTTKDGHPKHPLYVAGDTVLTAWR